MITVIEDDRVSQEFLCRIIASYTDCKITRYSTAEAFIRDAKIKGLEPSVIFLDVTLPGMTGIEALNAIKELSTCKDTPVIMCTSSQDKKTIMQSIKLGAANYLVKPPTKEVVEKIINKYSQQ